MTNIKPILRNWVYKEKCMERTEWREFYYGPVSSTCRMSGRSPLLSFKQSLQKVQVKVKI